MYKNLVLVLSTLQLALDLGLIARQITACSSTSQDHSTKSKDYSRAKLLYAVYSALHSQLLLLAAVHYNILPRLYAYCYASAVEHSLMTTQMAASLLFVLLLGLAMQLLTLPGSLYYTLVIEQHHGFNRSSLLLYLRDTLLSTLLAILIGLPLIALLLVTITYFGDSFYIYAACLFLAFTLFLNTVFPLYIQPLFNTFVPLQKGTLKTRIEHLCHELGFPLGGTSVVDGSKRSSHSNAYFYGLWSDKRIVLFDTLVQQSSVDQVVAVLAHELGHWKHSHIWKRLFGVQLHLALLFYVFSLVLKDELLFTSFGFLTRENVHLGKPDIVAFLLFQVP